MFSVDNATAEVHRLIYKDNKSSGRTLVGSYRGYLTIISADKLIDPTMYGKMYHFNTQSDADILKSDDLIIDGEKYSVKLVYKKQGIAIGFTRAEIIKDA